MKSRKKFNVTKKQVEKAKDAGIWRFTNKVLYNLFKKHPKHDKEIIIAKIWIIGRTHAASIERGAKTKDIDLLMQRAGERIKKLKLDKYISKIRNNRKKIELILEAHKKLVDIFKELTGLEKRSLASKYLHYHFPEFVFIYDSRAKKGFNVICPNYVTKRKRSKKFDDEYENFFLKMLDLQEWIKKEFKMPLKPREVDRLLLKKSQQSSKNIKN